MALKYERLANGVYAYTSTTQVVGDIDFTNPNHAYISGYYYCSSSSLGGDLTLLPTIMNTTNYSTYSVLGSTPVMRNSEPSQITGGCVSSKIIDGKTYYGLLAQKTFVFIPAVYNHNFTFQCTTRAKITYIKGGSNSIETKTVSLAGTHASISSSLNSAYFGFSMQNDDLILHIQFEQI